MRLIHLSDLHICHEDLLEPLEEIKGIVEKTGILGRKVLELEFASATRMRRLRETIGSMKPDVICISGDITSFGDHLSFRKAVDEVEELKKLCKAVIICPGNHDVLCSQLKKLIDTKLKWSLRLPRWLLLRKLYDRLKKLLARDGIFTDPGKPLANFRWFAQEASSHTIGLEVGHLCGSPVKVWCIPFDSVALDPLWVNIGETTEDEFRRFNGQLNSKRDEDAVLVAMLHHNPISSPDVIEPRLFNAYNSMPGASVYLREMQECGVDLVLYGHQHRHSCCLVDFLPNTKGHLYLLGAPSAVCGDAGFNVIDIHNRFHAQVTQYKRDQAGGYHPIEGESQSMVFECEHVSDHITVLTQKEVRRYRYENATTDPKWDDMYEPGVRDFLILGVRLQMLQIPERRGAILRLGQDDSNRNLRVLLSDPGLFDCLQTLPKPSKNKLERMFGENEDWEGQSRIARGALREMSILRPKLGEANLHKLEVRLSHTLMPIGGLVRNLREPDGSMLIRLLPMGVMGELVDRPMIYLEQRHDKALFSYFADYINALWEKGEPYNFDQDASQTNG